MSFGLADAQSFVKALTRWRLLNWPRSWSDGVRGARLPSAGVMWPRSPARHAGRGRFEVPGFGAYPATVGDGRKGCRPAKAGPAGKSATPKTPGPGAQRPPYVKGTATHMQGRGGAEEARLTETRERHAPWKKWGPYLSERQWGTVREDYSQTGNAWEYLTHDQARSDRKSVV